MILVDSSVAFKWLKSKNEPFFEQAVPLLERHLQGKTQIGVPPLLYIEIANALATKTATTSTIIRKDLRKLYEFGLEACRETQDDVITASRLAKGKTTTVYDMLYAVIAKRLGIHLITADEQFVKKTKFLHVKLLSEYQA